MATLREKLSSIQLEMKAPKNLRNAFGNYNYRNAESILEAFKPFGKKYKVALTLNDDVVQMGDRIYVKATATLLDLETDDSTTATAFAREPASKKGMDDSQVTGACSSYARKYALNGLFLLDDTKDADTDEYQKQDKAMSDKKADDAKKAEANRIKKVNEVLAALESNGIKNETVMALYKVDDLKKLTVEKCDNIMKHIEDIKKKQEESEN